MATRNRKRFFSKAALAIVLILIGAAILSIFLQDASDAAIILAIVLVSGLLGFWQEYGAANAVEKLRAVVGTKARALRDGAEVSVPLEEIVPGDVVLLSAGAIIPGDCRLLEARDLFVNEATLTGETYPVEKTPCVLAPETALARCTNAAFMGTNVVSGSGKALVVYTGRETEFGKVFESLKLRPPETEFEHGIRRFGYLLAEVTFVLVLAIFAFNVYFHKPVLDSFLFALALAVGLTPQLLPAIISINLSHGARRMAEKKSDHEAARRDRKLRQHERALFRQDRHDYRRKSPRPRRARRAGTRECKGVALRLSQCG